MSEDRYTEGEPFRRGDVVYTDVAGGTKGFAVVICNQRDSLLELHRGDYSRYFYLHSGWCRKVGQVGGDVLAACEAAHAEIKALDDEREERQRAYEASEERKAEEIKKEFRRLSARCQADVAKAIRAFDVDAKSPPTRPID